MAENPPVALRTGKHLSPLWRSSKKKGRQAKNDKCMAKLLLQRRKRVESGTGTSVPEIRVVGSNLKFNHSNFLTTTTTRHFVLASVTQERMFVL
jgi:hypothetical protein